MASLVEIVAKQAQLTFSRSITDENFADSLSKLIKCVSRIKADDVKLSRDEVRNATKTPAPVTYIEVTENKTFSMGIFLLRNGARIPLHDHPGMHGVLKVIHGSVRITSFSALSKVPEDYKLPQDIDNMIKSSQRELLIPVEKHMAGIITDKDEPCVLRPKEGNFHEIFATNGAAAFLDILAPPYDMKERDCHYYIPLETNKADSEVKAWLLKTTVPSNFWCGSAPYNGPSVNL